MAGCYSKTEQAWIVVRAIHACGVPSKTLVVGKVNEVPLGDLIVCWFVRPRTTYHVRTFLPSTIDEFGLF